MKCVNIRIDSGLTQFECPHCGLHGELDDELIELLWAKSSGQVPCPLPNGCGKRYGIPSAAEIQRHKSTAGTIPGSKTDKSDTLRDQITSSSKDSDSKKTFGGYECRSEAFKSVVRLALEENSVLRWKGEELTPRWLALHPEEAILISGTSLPEWHTRLRKDKWLLENAKLVREVDENEELKDSPDPRGSVIGLILDEEASLKWKEEEVTPQWLALHPEEAVMISTSILPEWHARLRKDKWLLENAKKIRRICADKELKHTALIEAVRLALNENSPLKWKGDEVTPDWLALHPKEAIHISETKIPEMYAQLRGENWLREKSDDIRRLCSEKNSLPQPLKLISVAVLLGGEAELSWAEFEFNEFSSKWWHENPKDGVDLLMTISPDWTQEDFGKSLCLPSSKSKFLHKLCREANYLKSAKLLRPLLHLVLDEEPYYISVKAPSLEYCPKECVSFGEDEPLPLYIWDGKNRCSVCGYEAEILYSADDFVCLSPFRWYGRKDDGEAVHILWLEINTSEALKIRESPMMKWYRAWYKHKGTLPPSISDPERITLDERLNDINRTKEMLLERDLLHQKGWRGWPERLKLWVIEDFTPAFIKVIGFAIIFGLYLFLQIKCD